MYRTLRGRAFATLTSWCVLLILLCGGLGASAAPVVPPAQPAPAPPPSEPAPAAPQLTLQQLFQQNAPAVVLIQQFDGNGKWTSLGSGFIVSPSGIVVTNNHVIKPDAGAVRIAVTLPARGDTFRDVRLIYTEARRDFAVLSIKGAGLPVVKAGDSDKIQVGDQVVAIGNPLDPSLALTFTVGYVEALRMKPGADYRFIQHQAPITPGNSGGPLFNMKGEVIGINTFNFKDSQNLNGAIPINYVKPYFDDHVGGTWEEYARINPPQAPAPSAGQQPPPAPRTPPPPAPPPAPTGWATLKVFERVSGYRAFQQGDYKLGYAAGIFDAVSMFAALAQSSSGIGRVDATDIYACVDGKGPKLGQLRDWVDSVTSSALNGDPMAPVLAKACQHSFPIALRFWDVSNYKPLSDLVKLGYSAGMFDAISLVAAATDSADVNTRIGALYGCLEAAAHRDPNHNLRGLREWIDSALSGASDTAPVVSVIAGACKP